MALNNSINTAALGAGFVYSDGLGGLSIGTPGGGGSVKVTKFTSSGTWTKDVDCQSVTVICWNGGSGGGSGRQGLTTAAGGGGGGIFGSVLIWSTLASFFNTTETVTIGTGGAGGATQASASSNGNNGSVGGVTSLGNLFVTNSLTSFGYGGTTTTSTNPQNGLLYIPVLATSPSVQVSANILSFTTGSNVDKLAVYNADWEGTAANLTYMPMSGGGGSGADSGVVRQGGGGIGFLSMGYNNTSIIAAGGTGGIASGTINGGAGNNAISTTGGRYIGATGGGGGGGQSGGASAGIGGAGGIPGGGGGGGGGSLDGTTSGAGGVGGRGELWVIEYLS